MYSIIRLALVGLMQSIYGIFASPGPGFVIGGAATSDADVTGVAGSAVPLTIIHNANNDFQEVLVGNGTTATAGASTAFFRTRSTASDANTILQNGDRIAGQYFFGAGGSDYVTAFQVLVEVDGTPGSADMPGRMRWMATLDGTTTAAEAMRLSNAGNLGLFATSFGASMAHGFAMGTGTAPSGDVADQFAMYSADIAAGNAAPHFRTENGSVVKIFQGALISDASGGAIVDAEARTAINTLLARMRANGLIAT